MMPHGPAKSHFHEFLLGRRRRSSATRALPLLGALLLSSSVPQPMAAQAVTSQTTSAASFAVTNVRLFDGQAVLDNATVIVRSGSIHSLGKRLHPPPGLTVRSEER